MATAFHTPAPLNLATVPILWWPGEGMRLPPPPWDMLLAHALDAHRPVGQPETTPRRERKPRRPSLSRAKREAERAGLSVSAFELHPGKIVVVPGEPEPAADAQGDDEVETWIRKHAH